MKIFVVENNYLRESVVDQGQIGWYLLADSAITNTGKPFYLPEDLGEVTVSVGAALRISRLGKSISEKFAGRYYQEVAPVVHFRLPEYKAHLIREGLSWDAAVNFDKSLFVGNFVPWAEVGTIEMRLSEDPVANWRKDSLRESPEQLISKLSRMNTLKMGDLVVVGLSPEKALRTGDRIEVSLSDTPAFIVKIK